MVWVVFNSIFLGNVWDLNCVNKKKNWKKRITLKLLVRFSEKILIYHKSPINKKKNSKYHFAIEAGVSTSKAMTFA